MLGLARACYDGKTGFWCQIALGSIAYDLVFPAGHLMLTDLGISEWNWPPWKQVELCDLSYNWFPWRQAMLSLIRVGLLCLVKAFFLCPWLLQVSCALGYCWPPMPLVTVDLLVGSQAVGFGQVSSHWFGPGWEMGLKGGRACVGWVRGKSHICWPLWDNVLFWSNLFVVL